VPIADNAAINALLRTLPQVEAVLSTPELIEAAGRWRRDVLKRLVQAEIAALRKSLSAGNGAQPSTVDAAQIAGSVMSRLSALEALPLRPVVNATGVLLHTNLGRAVLSPAARDAVAAIAGCYTNLEMELSTGKRTRRDVTLEPLLTALTGCESATVVNNNAAAVFLVLTTLAGGGEVVTSRGELVEIGGSYRVPDIVRSSGCTLVEVGTTNRTRIGDYEAAITERTTLLLKTHPSNYTVTGFTEEASLEELTALGRKHGVPVFYDLGSGYLPREGKTLLPEPDVLAALASGAELVSFSGDKLLGGPQAGIICGSRALIARLRKSPLWRMLRIDKFTAAALAATLLEHLQGGAQRGALSAQAAREVADALAGALHGIMPEATIEVIEAPGSWGGGSLPEEQFDSFAVTITVPEMNAGQIDHALRTGPHPVVGYGLKGIFALNVASLLPEDVEVIVEAFEELVR
jgi:L-seryl-tRNA(Ser) seleniumtransferase